MLVQLNRRARALLHRMPRDYAYGGAELALLLVLAVLLARLVWTVTTPVGPVGDWRPTLPAAAIPAGDPAILGSFDPFFRTTGAAGPAVVSTLGLALLGTRVDTVSGRGSAIIATPDGRQSSFLVGEEVMPGVRLGAVDFDAVTLDRGGVAESLFLDQSVPAATPEATPPAPILAAPAPAAPGLASQVGITPRLVDGAVTGYVLAPNGDGAAFRAAGLRRGDVLVSVDGEGVGSIADPASVATRLGGGPVSIGIERGGQPLTLRIGE